MAEANVIPLPRKPPHPGVLAKRIRELEAAGAYSFGKHVFERKGQRDITIQDAAEVLRLGEIDPLVEPGDNPGEWKCKMVGKVDKSSRKLGVATVVVNMSHLFLLTVEWEDK
jgi:hypothetical protein